MYAQGHAGPHGTGLVRQTGQPGQDPGRATTRPGDAQPGGAAASGGDQPRQGRFTSLDAAIGRLGRVIQELGNLVAALERAVERQVEQVRERSRGPGMGR